MADSPCRIRVYYITRKGAHNSETTDKAGAIVRLERCFRQRVEAVAYTVDDKSIEDRDCPWGGCGPDAAENPRTGRRMWDWWYWDGE